MEYKDPGRYIPIMYLLYSWGSRFGVPSRVPLIHPGALKSGRALLNGQDYVKKGPPNSKSGGFGTN